MPEYGEGFYGLQQVGGGWYRWTAEKAQVHLPVVRRGQPMRVRLMVGSFRPEGLPSASVRVSCSDRVLAEMELKSTHGNYVPIEVTLPPEATTGERATLVLESNTFNPQGGQGFEEDYRDLGIAVAKVKPAGLRHQIYDLVFERLIKEAGLRLAGIPDNLSLRYVDSYDLITPISVFVQTMAADLLGQEG